ncbi:MAG: nicotinate-nucleotide adenylyltransferase [Candidatus Thiodiazotropha sp.]
MIGVFGGTFDPIHFGHLRSALEVLQGLNLDQVRFIPLHGAVHRNPPEVTPGLRLRMVETAIAGQPGFVADDRELRRAGASYTVDTLRDIRREQPDQMLCLMMGLDAFNGFERWHLPEEILQLAHLIVMQRPGETRLTPAARQLLESRGCQGVAELRELRSGGILLRSFTQLQISATQIRDILKAGRSPRYLLPDGVIELITEHNLYASK